MGRRNFAVTDTLRSSHRNNRSFNDEGGLPLRLEHIGVVQVHISRAGTKFMPVVSPPEELIRIVKVLRGLLLSS